MKPETIKNLNLTILIINVIIMGYLVSLIVPNIEKAEKDPLNYGAKIYNINYCQCFTEDNIMFNFNKTAIWMNNPEVTKLVNPKY